MEIKYIDYREKWQSERDKYDKLGLETKNYISALLKSYGITAKTTYRVKDTDSLIKKIARKSSSYESIHDKVGVRIIAYFHKQMKMIDEILTNNCENYIAKREDMSIKQKENEFGYQSIHYDFCKIDNGLELFCEVQLRTICQDNWSELSHELAYKSEINLPKNIIREINSLSALFEVADNQFQLIQDLIEELPDANPIKLLNYLEKIYYTHIGSFYDKELSNIFLSNIDSLYEDNNPRLLIESFYNKNKDIILEKVEEYKDNLYFTQPEIIIILERMENQKYKLASYWENIYPIDDLEIIANAWGTSIN